ncbi:MAG: DNA mismatch repair protein MutS [Candidatus Krumholzibacteria bacterium]|nr:DNA mismatch repair protein MutS [Candidatus Krumholzibacteria bacterium]
MNTKPTPLMAQYQEIRRKYKDGILFFQVGDFYETFHDDARKVSAILNIALTSRDKKNPIPLAGVPIHAADVYVARLLKHGEKVIICDQIENPSEAKGIVRREVTDIITPGTSLSPATLDEKENNYILSMLREGDRCGMALIDVSTGEFAVAEEPVDAAGNLLAGFRITEALLPAGSDDLNAVARQGNPLVSVEELAPYRFNERESLEQLRAHFGVANLSCFGIEGKRLAAMAAGSLLSYVKDLRRNDLPHISALRLITPGDTMFLDAETIRNLELLESPGIDSRDTSLIRHIDRTRTAAGARTLRNWLSHPSRSSSVIKQRLDAVEAFCGEQILMRRLRGILTGYPDIERIVSRITTLKAGPRELLNLSDALERIPEVISCCGGITARLITESLEAVAGPGGVVELVSKSIEAGSPVRMRDGGFIKKGFNAELDSLIDSSENGRKWIASLQESERKRTGIPSLKVGYNRVFGYYLEVSRIHENKVPDDYICKQSLVSSQRYVTESLKENESRILTADSRRMELEKEIFLDVCSSISRESATLQRTARSMATLDVLSSLADLALEREYCRPEIDDSEDLVITEGRHPVVEMISDGNFIPNDLNMRPGDRQMLLITGPNMGGKSTYIRQAALISIMAQMGSYVPAARARIGVIDRIFTRIGSSDNLARGQSTFLVEMGETARILNNCTSKSLVLLDEIGRGTSTLDGMSIAWAVTEHLLDKNGARPRTLFATHFHELTALSEKYGRMRNMKVEVKEWGNSVIFLYRIIEGKSDKSYGIHVAQLAGMPAPVIGRAWEIFRELERKGISSPADPAPPARQDSLFDTNQDPVKEKLQGLDIDRLTPMEAHRILSELLKMTNDT